MTEKKNKLKAEAIAPQKTSLRQLSKGKDNEMEY